MSLWPYVLVTKAETPVLKICAMSPGLAVMHRGRRPIVVYAYARDVIT